MIDFQPAHRPYPYQVDAPGRLLMEVMLHPCPCGPALVIPVARWYP
jgi:hypothetical protein